MEDIDSPRTDEIRQLHRRALEEMTALVGAAEPLTWEHPTPCTDWNVAELIEHAVGLNLGLAEAALIGDAPAEAYAPRPLVMWADSVELVLRAFDGLDEDGRTFVAPVSTELSFAARDVLTIHLLDVVVHSWDLAVAIGAAYEPAEEAVSAIADMAALIAARSVPSTRVEFSAPIRDHAGQGDLWAHVLQRLGRDPRWVAPHDGPGAPATLRPVNLAERLGRFAETWSPKIVGRVNDHEVKVVKMLGEFEWHSHADTDELFVVVSGKMRIEMRHGSVELGPGDLYVVPKGVEHRPVAEVPTESVLLEPAGVINTGDAGGELTAVDEVLV